ncbi:hypothetical protein SDC9_63984 [bioreactor metagenome]|uniref:O-antigen ligase-related domain-containing protein n=1 Tax=bioreactor metagenome TaxID=1076179 RepID=A0A644XNM4_9ZZZZ|nr:O-antigen ligase family protein [Candidatus Metalachnospira sp.]
MRKTDFRRLDREQYTDIMFCSVVGYSLIIFTNNNIIRLIVGNTYNLDTAFVTLCYLFFAIKSLPQVLLSTKVRDSLFLLMLICLPLLAAFYSLSNFDITKRILHQVIFNCIPAYAFGISIKDYKQTCKYLYNFAWIALILLFFDVYIIEVLSSDHMLGYAALFCGCIFVVDLISRHKLINIIGLLVAIILTVQSDTAGSLVALTICSLIAALYYVKPLTPVKLLFLAIGTILVVAVIINYKVIVLAASTYLGKYNVNVNVLQEILDNNVAADRYRISIFNYCWEYAKTHLFWGCGVGNDRVLITQNTLVRYQKMLGNYPHNIFLEFMMQFGLIIGCIISICLVRFLLCYIVRENDTSAQKIMIILIAIGLLPLFYSSSYIENASFFLLVGFCIGRLRLIKRARMYSKRNRENQYDAN